MARGKYLSLEEARKMGALDQFAQGTSVQIGRTFLAVFASRR